MTPLSAEDSAARSPKKVSAISLFVEDLQAAKTVYVAGRLEVWLARLLAQQPDDIGASVACSSLSPYVCTRY